jgi:GTP-binding protein Era
VTTDPAAAEFRSGFVSLVGRPNVGKSTLVNALVGRKVSIVSDHPQTTRAQIRGVRTSAASQIVLLDTPGIHRPRTLLGERTNDRAVETLRAVDAVCHLVAADAPLGPGDRFVARLVAEAGTASVCVVNKIDRVDPARLATRLAELGAGALIGYDAFVPVSAVRGDGLDALVAELEGRLPPGPHYYPEGTWTDQPEGALAAEFLREQLIAGARDELPHSIAVAAEDVERRVTRGGEPLLAVRCVVRVERESQKGIVIGRRGERLRNAGTAARAELERLLGERVHLDTVVRVEPRWQRRAGALDRLGF